MIKRCLPSIIKSAGQSRFDVTVTLLDNGSTDGSVEWVESKFNNVVIYKSLMNKFLCSYNDFAKEVEDDVIILLNSDIITGDNFIDPLADIFIKNADALFAGPQCWTFDKSQYEGAMTKIRMHFGFFQAFARYPGYEKAIKNSGYTACVGSVVAFDRLKFLELGGYDELYFPGRMEDVDLCYRGWKAGYKGYYAPESLSYHEGLHSFHRAFGKDETLEMAYRNTFIFMWKNITDFSISLRCIAFLPVWLIYSLLYKPVITRAFIKALSMLGDIIKARRLCKPRFRYTDHYVFRMVGF